MGPTPEGPYGPVPSIFGGQAHLVSGNAEKLGTVEESVEVVLFFAGEEVQTRVAIDRGAFPMYKAVLDSPEFAAAPPENHSHWKTVANSTDHRHGQSSHPARVEIIQAAGWDKMINGEETVEEGVPKLIAAKDRVPRERARPIQRPQDMGWDALELGAVGDLLVAEAWRAAGGATRVR